MRFLMLSFSILSFSFLGCGAERQTEDYHLESAADLSLTAEKHPHGYTRSECFACHLPQNIHLVDHLGAPSFPLARSLVEAQGLASCSGCHGANGIAP